MLKPLFDNEVIRKCRLDYNLVMKANISNNYEENNARI